MEDFTLIQIRLPKEFDYKLNLYLAELKRTNKIKDKSKAQLILSLAEESLTKRSVKLIDEFADIL